MRLLQLLKKNQNPKKKSNFDFFRSFLTAAKNRFFLEEREN